MKKLKIVIFCSTLMVIITACSVDDRIYSISKNISTIDNSVFVTGRWKTVSSAKKHTSPAQINTVSISCHKDSMTCREVLAQLVTPNDEPSWKTKSLTVIEFTYSIANWSDEVIYATYAASVADFELRISVKDKVAEKRCRETKSRGSDTADPNLYYHLIVE
jgi:hypothetical protein